MAAIATNQGFYELTKDDLARMRKADRIMFRHDERGQRDELHGSVVVFGRAPERFDDPGETVVLSVPSYIERFSDDRNNELNYATCHKPVYRTLNDEFTTVVRHVLRPGDGVRLEWRVNSTIWTQEHNVCLDELALQVRRVKRGRPRYLLFLIGVSIGPDNTARMIRRGVWNTDSGHMPTS